MHVDRYQQCYCPPEPDFKDSCKLAKNSSRSTVVGESFEKESERISTKRKDLEWLQAVGSNSDAMSAMSISNSIVHLGH